MNAQLARMIVTFPVDYVPTQWAASHVRVKQASRVTESNVQVSFEKHIVV